MRFKLISLGCPKNLVDSEYIAYRLESAGHTISDDCDTIIINTCAFISEAVKESIATILSEAEEKEGINRKLVVTGCLVERYGERLNALLPEVDLFVGRGNYPEIGDLIGKDGCFLDGHRFSDTYPRRVLTTPPTAYLKIQEGCNNRCTYCKIPDIRGALENRDINGIVDEFKWLIENGYKEINIIGQDITAYGIDRGETLCSLLESLLQVNGDYHIRLLYMHPRGIDKALIGLIAKEERIIKYMDIPIQHSEDRILSMMGRGYTKAYLEDLMGEIRAVCPDCIVRTTVMVGFPGESEEEFTSLCDFIKRWGVDIIGAFIYSREEGTKAFRIKGHIKSNIKRLRFEKVMELQNEISRERLQRLIGSKTKVIVEEEGERFNTGRILEQAPDVDGIAFIKGRCIKGEIRECKVVKTIDYDVVVELEI